MRLHHLTVTAFGPFPGTECVDFDELNDAGLFLLTGPTGAGKTSLLDAVCFALYGTVPGVREVRSLRSQHAAGDVAPEVVLDFSVRGRRFVVRRRPEWSRLKRRGTGVTTEKASASITETTGGVDHFLSARAAEVGLLMGDLMGMTAGQFTQVALLPQGEFQTFLRASSQDRHDVLQQLFRTDRFARIEEWVVDHSRLLRDEAESGRVTVQRLLDTTSDRAGLSTPEDLSGDGLAAATAQGRTLPWVAGVVAAAEVEAGVARERLRAAAGAQSAARALLERESRLAELRQRRDDARMALASLTGSADAADEARRRLREHERALRCLPVAEVADRANADAAVASERVDRAVAALRGFPHEVSRSVSDAEMVLELLERRPWDRQLPEPLPGAATPSESVESATPSESVESTAPPQSVAPPESPEVSGPVTDQVADLVAGLVAGLVDAARQRIAVLEALLPRERAAVAARASWREDLQRLEVTEAVLAAATARAAGLPADISATETAVARFAGRAVRRHALEAEVTGAQALHQAALDLIPARDRLQTLEDTRRDLRDVTQDARELLQSLVARRLTGMAAELAGVLADGDPCQVCGSPEHPRPAEPADDAVTDADQADAEAALTRTQVRFDAADLAVQLARREHDGLEQASGGLGPVEAAERLAARTSELADADAAGVQQQQLEQALRDLRAEQLAITDELADAASAAAGLRESAAAHRRIVDAVEAEAATALGTSYDASVAPSSTSPHDAAGSPSPPDVERPSVQATLQALAGWSELLSTVREALVDHHRSRELRDDAQRRAVEQAVEHGFDSLDRLAAAVLETRECGRLEALLREREASAAAARTVLDDPALAELDDRAAVAPDPSDDREPDLLDLVLELAGEPPTGPGRADPTPAHDVPAEQDAEPAVLLARLAQECTVAEATAAGAARASALAEDRVTALRGAQARLADALDSWAPVRDRSLRATSIAQLVKGRGHDNQLQMRLSAYVLATRLDQVVAAANERLGHMRDQRYVLQRTGRAERRGTQAGLGLEVVDQWTGDTRSPGTLSGGETFVVSLSLALGLADVVTHEAGGTEIETLFVDEGFGTLDADTLDDVMDRLDSLRAGGRTVGVVSHVTELRNRIPTQIQVDKGRHGSTVSVRTLVG